MTEHADSQISDAQRDRIARLAARRNPPASGPSTRSTAGSALPPPALVTPSGERPARRGRRHAAAKSRIAAAGLGAATMFGIVTVLGLDHPFAGTESTPPPPPSTPQATAPAAPPIQVVIHRIPATVPPSGEVTPEVPATDAPPAPEPTAAPEPIVLTATPVVQTVTVTVPQQASAPRRSNSTTQASAPAPAPAPPAATTSGSN